MTTTTNLGLKKPENSDYVDVSVLNENMDKLDEAVPAAAGNALKESGTKDTPADNDGVVIVDSADSSKIKRVLWSKIKALFAPATHAAQHSASGSDPVTPADIGAVKKSGDTMTGNLGIVKASFPTISLNDTTNSSYGSFQNSDHVTEIGSKTSNASGADYRSMRIYDNLSVSDLKEAFKLVDRTDGAVRSYDILHTGNLADIGVAKIATGTYTGTGTYGEKNPNSLTFDFEPKLVLIKASLQVTTFIRPATKGNTWYSNAQGGHYTATWSGKTLSWYAGDDDYWYGAGGSTTDTGAPGQLNESGTTYYYVAIS